MPTRREPRKLTVAIDDPELRRELSELLARADLDLRFVPSAQAANLDALDADAVVVSADTLAGDGVELLEQAREDDAPGIVVLASEREDLDDVRLVAAGASAVVDTTSGSDREIREQLVGFVEAEADGGLHGPEGSGAEAEPKLADFQSRSPTMRGFLELVKRVADSDSTLLVTGETGVGKERLARAIHAESSRSRKPFVAVNCGALPENLLESELFGHERGAFTGANEARAGRFEEADGGTIFLDEIGEMSPNLQVHLLTVLQRREIRRLGAPSARPIDVRVISATNRDLASDVAEGRFREDLLYRLNVVELKIPPLRERREDLPVLVGRFLRHFVEAHDRPEIVGLEEGALEALVDYAWPGNVREVVNVVERAVLLCRGARIRRQDLPEALRGASAPAARGDDGPGEVDESSFELPLGEAKRRLIERFERRYLDLHLQRASGVIAQVAESAGINPRTVYEKMRRYGLRKEDY